MSDRGGTTTPSSHPVTVTDRRRPFSPPMIGPAQAGSPAVRAAAPARPDPLRVIL